MRDTASFFIKQNISFMFYSKELSTDHIKAPVHWGVNATVPWCLVGLEYIKAPVHWGVNAT